MADIKVFISSVQREFERERRQLCDYIRTDALLGQFFVPFIFEDLPASEISAQKAYLTQAAACHIYLGIFGIQYGYEDADGVSPTEREYDTATAHFAHRLIYTLRTNTERHPKEQAFISKVEQEVVRRGFSTYEELRTAVYNSLIDYLVKKEVIRRVPFDAAAHPTATYDDIDPEHVRTFVNKAREKRKFSLTFADGIEQIFSGIHVLTDDGRLTNSALMHSSEPTNPVIAHPLFLTGYIEHLGTGTTDMIADCEEYGLRTPEFIQAEDFRTIIWRKEKVSDPSPKVSDLNEKVSNPSPKVSDHGEKVTEQDAESNRVRLTAKQQKVLEFCNEMPRTAREIIEMIGVKYHTKTLEQYINKLVYSGFLRPTQGKSHDSNRKYITAHDGE